MVHGAKPIRLPDRPAITLCEAVTALCYGKACRALELSEYRYRNQSARAEGRELSTEERLYGEEPSQEQKATAEKLIGQLQNAAYAGRIKFRARKKGGYSTDEHTEIDSLYFSLNRGFQWDEDTICELDPNLGFSDYTYDWCDVHLDRQQFEVLLREIGISVQQNPVADVPSRTGMPGRPTSKHLVLDIARRRLQAGDCPPTLVEFSRQLAGELSREEPRAAPMTAKTVANAIRDLWRDHRKLIKPANLA